MHSAEKITRAEFDEALGRYPALIKSISSSKPSKEGQGQLTLEQLDRYRFEVAPHRYYNKAELEDSAAAPMPLTHADVVQLVRWKLKHGTFRPALMKQAESNSEDEIKTISREAFETYKHDNFAIIKAINKLTTLKGIGPATASLLLSVHDPSRVVFFGDEVYQWLCHDGQKANIKYSIKEYEDLVSYSRKLIDRLGVDGRDVEKVGYVLFRESNASNEPHSTTANGVAADESTTGKTATSAPRGRGRPPKDPNAAKSDAKAVPPAKIPREKKTKAPAKPKEPTEMTVERKAQLQSMAEKGRLARVKKAEARAAKGAKFRERVDNARANKAENGDSDGEDSARTPVKAGAKRKSDVATRALTASAKRPRRSDS